MEDMNFKLKIIKKVRIPVSNSGSGIRLNLYIFLAEYGYTPYKVDILPTGDPNEYRSCDFWFTHFLKPKAIDYVETFSKRTGFTINFWFAYEKDIGLKVLPLSSLRVYEANEIYDKVVKEGEVLLTEPEFNIHQRLQQLYFNNEKEISWD